MAKNPNELDVICHKSRSDIKTFATTAEFQLLTEDKDDFPFREPSLSRLEASLIIKDEKEKNVYVANIPARDLYEIKLKTEIAVTALMTRPLQNSSESAGDFSNSPAFTVPLMLTAFKGRTAAAVLLENPANKDALLKGKSFLEANLSKYPANKKQIDAIDEAIKLLEIGELSTGASIPQTANNIMTIYEKNCKYKSTTDEKGNKLVYSILITCDPTRNFPFEIAITNCYAPVVSSGNGQTIVKMSEATGLKKGVLAVSDSEWIGWVGQAYGLYLNFKSDSYPTRFERVERLKKNSYNG